MKPTPVKTADEARAKAIDWQSWQAGQSLSYYDLAKWQEYFRKLARQFPELRNEFEENAII